MKYKVGDKVKIVKPVCYTGVNIGDVATVIVVDENEYTRLPYRLEYESGRQIWTTETEVELVHGVGEVSDVVEVNGKKYKECGYDEYLNVEGNLRIRVDGKKKYYKELIYDDESIHSYIEERISEMKAANESLDGDISPRYSEDFIKVCEAIVDLNKRLEKIENK